ncbi:unnamed protein product [Nezara viridula]|uniref:Uncharacterized protein n=1 Tax=Nezara viridula TaxID=85310 RepID=A0A9P0H2S5_NEZVI|nr:unnamed protein product [Nezara viridula]
MPQSWSISKSNRALSTNEGAEEEETKGMTRGWLLLIASAAASQRGHYIVDYQRLPLYQEFYLSPGVYRPLFTGRQDAVVQSRAVADSKEEQQPGPPVAQALQQQVSGESHEAHVVEAAPAAEVQEQQAVQEQQQQVVQAQQQQAVRDEQHIPQQQAVHSLPVLQYSNSMTPDGSYSYKWV